MTDVQTEVDPRAEALAEAVEQSSDANACSLGTSAHTRFTSSEQPPPPEYKWQSWQDRGLPLFLDLIFHSSQNPSWKQLSLLSLIKQLQSRGSKALKCPLPSLFLSRSSFLSPTDWAPNPVPLHQCRARAH